MRLFVFIIVFLFANDVFAQKTKRKKSHVQGIKGTVVWKAGNHMPSPDRPLSENVGTPIIREIWIYELTNEDRTEKSEEGFYTKINTKFIKKIKTDSLGKFIIKLPVGYYSVFTKEPKGYWANNFDDANNIQPVAIKSRNFTYLQIIIDYAASY